MDTMQIQEIKDIAREIRRKIINMAYTSQSSHSGSALSPVDIMSVLYFHVMNVSPKNPSDNNRDRFILSKGHGCMSLYATLCQRGFFDQSVLEGFYKDGGTLFGHPTREIAPGIEASTGSLGHGLSIGVGISLALKKDKNDARTFVLMSDGECDEGSVWEAILCAAHFKLDNLVVIVDYNKIQSFGRTNDVINLEPLAEKWKSFGWNAIEIGGHDIEQIISAFSKIPFKTGSPSVVIAHTVKGKGVSFMEDKLEWHYKSPNEDQKKAAFKELGF